MRGRVGPQSAHMQPLITPTTVINGGDEDNLYKIQFFLFVERTNRRREIICWLGERIQDCAKEFLLWCQFLFLVLTKIQFSMNNMYNTSSCDIASTLLYCYYWWYICSNPSFFIGQVLLTTDVWSSLWDVFYCDVGPPILVCWYTRSSVGTHGRLSGGNTYIAWLITLLCSITMTPLVAAQHNNTVELIVPLLIMRASLPFICQLTRATTRTRFSWVGVE